MIITIDGYDGTGKTSLAKKIAKEKNYTYIEKPFILKYSIEHDCSMKEAKEATSLIEKKLYEQGDKQKLIDFYCDGILWLEKIKDNTNIVLDRGVLTTYAVFGNKETEGEFIKYLNRGIAFDLSIYLTADDIERRKRIMDNDPLDPDLKYPIKWRKNNLEEFANEQGINYLKIETDGLSKEEVAQKALDMLSETLEPPHQKKLNKIRRL